MEPVRFGTTPGRPGTQKSSRPQDCYLEDESLNKLRGTTSVRGPIANLPPLRVRPLRLYPISVTGDPGIASLGLCPIPYAAQRLFQIRRFAAPFHHSGALCERCRLPTLLFIACVYVSNYLQVYFGREGSVNNKALTGNSPSLGDSPFLLQKESRSPLRANPPSMQHIPSTPKPHPPSQSPAAACPTALLRSGYSLPRRRRSRIGC